MDLAMGVAVGSSIQIALLVTPFLVIVGWIIGAPMTLHFETCEFNPFPFCVIFTDKLPSPNCCLWSFCPRCYVYCPGWQIQLPGGCYAYGSLYYHRIGFLCHSIRCLGPRQLNARVPLMS